MPPKPEIHLWEWPVHPWHRLHIDYAGPIGKNYLLVIVDAINKWVEVFPTKAPTSQETIKCVRGCFALFGLPVSVVSDNGPYFSSSLFKEY